jgi:hypothetical protein
MCREDRKDGPPVGKRTDLAPAESKSIELFKYNWRAVKALLFGSFYLPCPNIPHVRCVKALIDCVKVPLGVAISL